MKNRSILVIGASGQLGSELTQALVDRYGSERVLATDIRDPRSWPNGANFARLDVLDRVQLQDLVHKHSVTEIYHLAAVLSAKGERDPHFAWRLNMESLLNVLEVARTDDVEKVFWPSSIAVFGNNTPKENTPQATIMDPSTIYGISKLAGERWCEWYCQKHGLDVRSLRYPGLIGYKNPPGGGTTDYAVEIFFKALTEKRYTCFLEPDTALPMMYMDDAIKATLDLMEAPTERITVRSSYNITGMTFSPAGIANEIRRHIPDFTVTYEPDYRQAIAASWPKSIDDTQARRDWGWRPDFDLARMVQEILEKLPSLLQREKA